MKEYNLEKMAWADLYGDQKIYMARYISGAYGDKQELFVKVTNQMNNEGFNLKARIEEDIRNAIKIVEAEGHDVSTRKFEVRIWDYLSDPIRTFIENLGIGYKYRPIRDEVINNFDKNDTNENRRNFDINRMLWNELTKEQTKYFKEWLEDYTKGGDIGYMTRLEIAWDMITKGFDLEDRLKYSIEETFINAKKTYGKLGEDMLFAVLPKRDQKLISVLNLQNEYFKIHQALLKDK